MCITYVDDKSVQKMHEQLAQFYLYHIVSRTRKHITHNNIRSGSWYNCYNWDSSAGHGLLLLQKKKNNGLLHLAR